MRETTFTIWAELWWGEGEGALPGLDWHMAVGYIDWTNREGGSYKAWFGPAQGRKCQGGETKGGEASPGSEVCHPDRTYMHRTGMGWIGCHGNEDQR